MRVRMRVGVRAQGRHACRWLWRPFCGCGAVVPRICVVKICWRELNIVSFGSDGLSESGREWDEERERGKDFG